MSEMRVPITDAFDESAHLESVEAELTSRQIEWLREKADERDLSLDHVLRSVITAQIRAQDDSLEDTGSRSKPDNEQPSVRSSSSPAASSPPAQSDAQEPATSNGTSTEDESRDDSPSIVDSLRSASERLQDLTEKDDEAETPDPHDTLKRLQARLGETSDDADKVEEESPGTVILQNHDRSMFDMMEDGE
jgi:hypothetical protein